MKISIITVCYNAANCIEKCIQSILNQTYKNIEYIIIDGNSQDDTLAIISKYSASISKVVSEPDKGLYDAMNKGIKLATGDVIGMLNADDQFAHSKVLENIASTFLNEDKDALYADLEYVKKGKVIRYWKSGDYDINNWYRGWMPPHPTFYVKSEVYKKHGFFNLELKLAADYELMLRFLLKNKISVSYLKEVTIKMEVGGESNKTIKNRIKANREDRKAWFLNNLNMPFYLQIAKPFSKLLQFVRR